MSVHLTEESITILSEGTRLEGKVSFDSVTRIHGMIAGEVHAESGSTVILAETGVIEGDIFADTLMIDGYVKGSIVAKTRVVLSGTARVIGSIKSPALIVEFGAYFDGKSQMEGASTTSDRALKPA